MTFHDWLNEAAAGEQDRAKALCSFRPGWAA